MASPSKEKNVVELFYNNATKHWHFEELLKVSGSSRSKASKWLSQLVRQNIIIKVKTEHHMPFYVAHFEHPAYRNSKKLFMLTWFYETGFLDHLMSLPKAKTVIIFGSMARADWYENSDIDVFIYGDPVGLNLGEYEMKLHRDIQLFACHGKKDVIRLGEGFIKNIINGNIVKGDLDFVRVDVHA